MPKTFHAIRKRKGLRPFKNHFGKEKVGATRFETLPQSDVHALATSLEEVARWVKDPQIARRVSKLKNQFPYGTLPELVAYDYLVRNNANFIYQAEVAGGHARGGFQPDFVVIAAGRALAWLIQGEFFHSATFQFRHGQLDRDLRARMFLKGQVVNGIRIDTVVELWESNVYNRNPEVFDYAMTGVELPH